MFYALAFDREDPPAVQVVKLTELIERIWKSATGGDPGLHLHLVDCIHEGVRYALENGMSSKEAMSSFRNYYLIHPTPFSQSLKEHIMTTVVSILNKLPRKPYDGMDRGAVAQLLKVKAPMS